MSRGGNRVRKGKFRDLQDAVGRRRDGEELKGRNLGITGTRAERGNRAERCSRRCANEGWRSDQRVLKLGQLHAGNILQVRTRAKQDRTRIIWKGRKADSSIGGP